ncbi:MAG: hypothetical protein H6710_12250 [Myxococcales bacterium]|nr:hypothetical protein [Myxococcales bacterium]
MSATSDVERRRSPSMVAALSSTMLTIPRELRRRGHALPWWVAALVIAALSSGCAQKASHEAQAPGMDAGGRELSLVELEMELDSNERRLERAGVALPPPRLAGSTATSSGSTQNYARAPAESGGDADAAGVDEATGPESAPARPAEPAPTVEESVVTTSKASSTRDRRRERQQCDDVCDLAGSICGLEDQICGLATRHPGEGRYAEGCERAAGDCRAASEACHACG